MYAIRLKIIHFITKVTTLYKFPGGGIIRRFIKRKLTPAVNGPIICPTIYGFKLFIDPVFDKGIEKKIFETGTYERGTLQIIDKCLKKGDIFLDIGSNIGLMSLFASKKVKNEGTIFSFEPLPGTFRMLEENIKLNKAQNISAYKFAIGNKTATEKIYTSDLNRGSASLIKPDISDNQNSFTTKTISLDDFVVNSGIDIVKMIKIDVEGWELNVLKGASATLKKDPSPILCIEYSSLHALKDGNLIDIYYFIKNLKKYRIFKLKNGKETYSQLTEITNECELPNHDNLFCFTEEHLALVKDLI